MVVPVDKQELRSRSVKELKTLLSNEGYDPNQISGVEKDELVEKVAMLLQNPPDEDEYPLPLYSNCKPQFFLRGLLILGLMTFVLSYWLSTRNVMIVVTLWVAIIMGRNISIRKQKALQRRKRT
eukprot:TRINITY_DN76601_c0_g1_i1.p3 TRINITY_DN76601_c0_g1~~TRINITY_DN76601_c0_g1_i1.p3  ORF type:complete len:124 (+),score=23.83 TRINITY_DN76601_c0_g1_i1:89-460(+)